MLESNATLSLQISRVYFGVRTIVKSSSNGTIASPILKFKTEENRDKFSIIDFHYDICYDNIELSVILQIIDDTNSNYQRRKNIFNPKARYIGITEGNLWDYMKCYYLLFAE